MTEGVDWFAIATAAAAVAGPIIAVWITRASDDRKEFYSRRMNIFRTLMRTRKLPIHFDHVGALNLIEIDFASNAKVMTAWRTYLANLGEDFPAGAAEPVQAAFQKKRDTLLTKLISEIAKDLKFNVGEMDIFEGNYIPQGWHDEDWEQRLVRRGLADVLSGRRPLMIQQFVAPVGYPPPPRVQANNAIPPPST